MLSYNEKFLYRIIHISIQIINLHDCSAVAYCFFLYILIRITLSSYLRISICQSIHTVGSCKTAYICYTVLWHYCRRHLLSRLAVSYTAAIICQYITAFLVKLKLSGYWCYSKKRSS